MNNQQRDLVADWLSYFDHFDGQRIAAIDIHTGRQFSYSQFNQRANALAFGLQHQFNIQKGERVALLAQNSTDYFEIIFACWKLGAVFMPLNWRLSPTEAAEILDDAKPSVILYDDEFSALVANSHIQMLERSLDLASSPYEQFISTHQQQGAGLKPAEVTLDDINTLLYTSGTTGAPKGVIGTYRMTQTSVLQQSSIIDEDSVCLTYAPLFHTAGLNSYALPLFHFGGTVCVMRGWDADIAMKYLNDEQTRVTHTLGVPFHLTVLSQHPDFESAQFANLKIIGVGGAPANSELIERWHKKGVPLSQSYGMTEIFGVAYQPLEAARKNPKAAGKAVMYTDLQIGDSNGEAVAHGETGEIQVRSPGLMPGYWNKPEETQASFANGWFRTGDAGRMDSDGTLYIVDRIKDMFISGGENVYPIEIENVISKLPGVALVAVIGVPDSKWQEVGKAIIMLRKGAQLSEDEVLAACKDKLAKYKVPKSVEFVPGLPISGQGKILKRELRSQYTNKDNINESNAGE